MNSCGTINKILNCFKITIAATSRMMVRVAFHPVLRIRLRATTTTMPVRNTSKEFVVSTNNATITAVNFSLFQT